MLGIKPGNLHLSRRCLLYIHRKIQLRQPSHGLPYAFLTPLTLLVDEDHSHTLTLRQVMCTHAGTISWLSGCALWGTSMEYVRRNYFEVRLSSPESSLVADVLSTHRQILQYLQRTNPGQASALRGWQYQHVVHQQHNMLSEGFL